MRVGIVGLGRIGRMHARNFARTPGVDEIVLIGRDPARTADALAHVEAPLAPEAPVEVAGAFAPAGDAAPVSSRLEGLSEAMREIDALVIASTTATHPELSLAAARAGVPTLVEKPLALDPDELVRLADEIDATGTPVAVAFHRRYDPAHQRLKQRVQAGDAGRLRLLRGTGHDHHPLPADYIPVSGGIWLDMMVHDFDTIQWIADEPILSVHATGSILDDPVYAQYEDVDTGVAVMTLASGALAVVTGTRRNGAGQDVRLEVFGSEGTFGAGVEPATPVTSTDPGVAPPAPPYDRFSDRFEVAFRAESAHFVAMAAGAAPNLTPPRAGLAAVRVAHAATASQRTGRTVEVRHDGGAHSSK